MFNSEVGDRTIKENKDSFVVAREEELLPHVGRGISVPHAEVSPVDYWGKVDLDPSAPHFQVFEKIKVENRLFCQNF